MQFQTFHWLSHQELWALLYATQEYQGRYNPNVRFKGKIRQLNISELLEQAVVSAPRDFLNFTTNPVIS